MRKSYKFAGLLLVIGALVFVAGMRVGTMRGTEVVTHYPKDDACCSQPVNQAVQDAPKLNIPTDSGLPCLVDFRSDECDESRRMAGVMQEITPQLQAKVDVVTVDAELYPAENQRWRLRMVPTQILVDAQGNELWRHEGFISAEELLVKIHSAEESKPTAAFNGSRPQ